MSSTHVKKEDGTQDFEAFIKSETSAGRRDGPTGSCDVGSARVEHEKVSAGWETTFLFHGQR
jgi:hypothetical protein